MSTLLPEPMNTVVCCDGTWDTPDQRRSLRAAAFTDHTTLTAALRLAAVEHGYSVTDLLDSRVSSRYFSCQCHLGA
jgi:hypothetical protein